ncbi:MULTISPECIES: hypothetical protein [unclassified Polaromonas]|uniref:hypothetical protein n=1 Tax=unclassified Polaromonas TaxID=2638319 RepID=UPI0025DADC05|nr:MULTISPECIES: hypothetical protein [unclassified Polaromonas]
MSELAYRLGLQQRALSRQRLFKCDAADRRSREFHFACAQRLAGRIISGEY